MTKIRRLTACRFESGPRHHPFSQLSRQLDMTTLARTSGHNNLRFLQERYLRGDAGADCGASVIVSWHVCPLWTAPVRTDQGRGG
ncbi:hypothetical protein BCAR13_980030 [Paraburkholderia caribensis]|nr:hypothetical protein BCAR13_980030 [Paraburkholderia caribensis]